MQIAATSAHDAQRQQRDLAPHRLPQLHRRLRRPVDPVGAVDRVPVHEQVEPRTRAQLEQPDPLVPRSAEHVEQPDQQRGTPTDLVGLRRDLECLAQFLDVVGDHRPEHRPGLGGVSGAAEAGVVRQQLVGPAGEHEPEDPGQQPQLDHGSARCFLVASADLADRSACVPVVGHLLAWRTRTGWWSGPRPSVGTGRPACRPRRRSRTSLGEAPVERPPGEQGAGLLPTLQTRVEPVGGARCAESVPVRSASQPAAVGNPPREIGVGVVSERQVLAAATAATAT